MLPIISKLPLPVRAFPFCGCELRDLARWPARTAGSRADPKRLFDGHEVGLLRFQTRARRFIPYRLPRSSGLAALCSGVLLVLLSGCESTGGRPSAAEINAAAAATVPPEMADVRFEFDQPGYKLAFVNRSAINVLRNEYIPADESLDRWSRMVTVRVFPDLDDPRQFMAVVLQNILHHNPQTGGEIGQIEETGQYTLDFLTWKDGVSEWSHWMAEASRRPEGWVIHQFSLRAYDDDPEKPEWFVHFAEMRPQLIERARAIDYPEPVLEKGRR